VAQHSVQINKNLLKHLRSQKGETQSETANACFVGERQYQNIEKFGRTTSKVISSIAQHFMISKEELKNNVKEDNSLWFVTDPYQLAGHVEQGYYKVLEEIKKLAKGVPDIFSPKLDIRSYEQRKEIKISYDDNEYCWTMRPLHLNKKIGLVWADLSEWQQIDWDYSIQELIYGYVYDVHIDGSPLIPSECSPQFFVEFIEVGQSKIFNKGYRLFRTDAEFRVSLTKWVDSISFPVLPTFFNKGCLSINYDFSGDMTKAIKIRRVWLDEGGKRHNAPWPESNIEKVIEAITDKKGGQRRWGIPIGLNEIFTGGEPAPVTPEVTCNEITELSQIEFSKVEIKRNDK
jgi:hypothetical protein